MTSRGSRSVRGFVLVALAATLAIPAAARPTPASAVSGPTCPWTLRLYTDVTNVAFPDQYANYFILRVPGGGPIPATPGSTLTITGRYPHTRYISFTSYTPQTQAIDGANDVSIDPDPGGVNPFLPGAARYLPDAQRGYTVTVVAGQRTDDRHNTVYTTSKDGSHTATDFNLIYRTYRPDRGFTPGGGEPLPSVTLDVGGQHIPIGDASQCDDSNTLASNQFNDTVAQSSVPTVLPGGCYPGKNPPLWHKFLNLPSSYVQGTDSTCPTGQGASDAAYPVSSRLPSGGFLENLDNKYVTALLNADFFGPVILIQSRIPTTPQTYEHAATMGMGQLRYWSMCTNDPISTRYFGCLMDDNAMRLDSAGDYCLVISSAANRPRNANAQHGVNWLPYGPFHTDAAIERNMLPRADFAQAIQKATYGQEQADLGAYYPATTYTTVSKFEQTGCGTHPATIYGSQPGDAGSGLPGTGTGAAPVAVAAALAPVILGLCVAGLWALCRRRPEATA
ncbi:MAG: hypothetical protein QOK05_11 [Chloroflexota bacterium]|jgi:hypothetical protein|nr:hypothetical protein [Chloroflexota bacterium]